MLLNLKAIALTDAEVEDICRQYDESAYPEYAGGLIQVIVRNDSSYFGNDVIPFGEVVEKVHPKWGFDKSSVAFYDYGNIILKKNVACVLVQGVGDDF